MVSMKRIYSFVLATILCTCNLSAQIFDGETYLGIGISSITFNGDNPANKQIFPKGNNTTVGGGFPNAQTALSLRTTLSIDKNRTYRIPISFDYVLLSGVQRLPDKFYNIYATHSVHIPTISAGFEYAFLSLPLANAKLYAAADIKLSMIQKSELIVNLDYENKDFRDTTRIYGKETATRLGMGLRIGVDGEVFAPWYVNISAGYNAFNLLGRNDSRGELFTPSNLSEKVESIIGAIATTILIQYKL